MRDLVKDWSETDLQYLWYENNREKTFNADLTTLKKHQANMSLLQEIVDNGCVAQDPTPPPPNGGRQVASASPNRLFVGDPNDKLTVGYSQEGFIVPGARPVYTIRFENETNATAAVQLVAVTDQLDPNLDWSTFELMGMGCNLVELPDRPAWITMPRTRSWPRTRKNVAAVRATLDPAVTGVLSWVMTSIDPVTAQVVEDPIAGFLPPNDAQHRGEGYVSFSIRPKRTLANGTVINNKARIVFDVNAPIDTPAVTNTLDLLAPTSSVQPLPAISSATFDVRWVGADDPQGSGLASFDIYVSTDGGAFAPWLTGVTNTGATFAGHAGSTYRFFSVARDSVGNVEASRPPPMPPRPSRRCRLHRVLQIRYLLTGLVQVSWPTSAVNYVLQAGPALSAAPDWRTVTNRPSIVGDQLMLTLSAQDGARYYRLYALPQLTIQWTNSQVMLSWPKSATDFRLLTATSLLPVTQWQAMSYAPLTNADRSVLFIAPGNPSRFYRLVSP